MWSSLGLPKPDRLVTNRRYTDTLSEIYGFSSVQRGAVDIRIDRLKKPARLKALLAELGNPQEAFSCILVAGTKGKGSTAAMIASVLRAAGLKVGRYTQPHLVSWRERTWVNGRYLSIEQTIRLFPRVDTAARRVQSARPDLGLLTTFEIGTAFSLLSFALSGVQIAVVEVGVGGRNDATNALDPLLSVITPISFDHADVIGPGIADIAAEKSGVMRPDRTVILAHQPTDAANVLRKAAKSIGARPVWMGDDWSWRGASKGVPVNTEVFCIEGPGERFAGLRLPLLGDFQRDNATAAVAAVSGARVVPEGHLARAVAGGLAGLIWPGRVHLLSERPRLIFDGAHNAESARQLESTIRKSFGDVPIHWVLGMSKGKDIPGFLDAIRESACSLTATSASHERSMAAESLADLARSTFSSGRHPVRIDSCSDPVRALDAALERAHDSDVVCAAGSFFLLGDLYSDCLNQAG
ncbi:MAG TPA: folylpolyglutamate synthase/dihydrofolate synthase family protein [Chloroflexota bacterium]|nr:folylpolyglutamate synthase/dihydrofolate synthase family protein [Chloroflexota bacterium]